MGTRKSKHNKGRKPLYKHFERDTVRTFQSEPEMMRTRIIPDMRHRRTYQPENTDKVVALTAEVQRYIARRREIEARQESVKEFPKPSGEQFHLIDGSMFLPYFSDGRHDVVRPSERDVLLQLFVERKISAGQMHAGRRWQADKEWATLQPSRTIDWSASTRPYQARGTVTGSQWGAMKRRRSFIDAEGIAVATFLDFCLEPDRGLADVVRRTGAAVVILECAIDDLLTRLCRHFGGNRAARA